MPTTSAMAGSRTGRTDGRQPPSPTARQPKQHDKCRQCRRDPEGEVEAGKECRDLRQAALQGSVAPGLKQQHQHRRTGYRAQGSCHHDKAAGDASVGAGDRSRNDVEIRHLKQPNSEALKRHRRSKDRDVRRRIGATDQHLSDSHAGRPEQRQQPWRDARRKPCRERRRQGSAGRRTGEQQTCREGASIHRSGSR